MIGSGPKRTSVTVRPPDLCASKPKFACAYSGVLFTISLIASCVAPTVPSEPRPYRMHCFTEEGSVFIGGGMGSEVWHTSSSTPSVKCIFGFSAFMLSNTAFTRFGVNCLPPTPNSPGITLMSRSRSRTAQFTSRNSGSAYALSSMILSSTVIFFTVFGSAAAKCFSEKGLHRCTFITPTFSPFWFR